MTNALKKRRIDEPCFYFAACKMPLTAHELDLALGHHALRVQPTDFSLIC